MSIAAHSANAGEGQRLVIKDMAFLRSGRIRVSFADGTHRIISQQAYLSALLYPGKRLTAAEWRAILAVDGEATARAYVEMLMGRRLYAPGEIIDKLVHVKKLDYATAGSIVAKLCREGLIDEKSYASQLIEELKNKGYAPEGIAKALEKKKISPATIAANASLINDARWGAAVEFLLAFARRHPDDSYRLQMLKMRQALALKGFAPNQADEALERAQASDAALVSQEREDRALHKAATALYARLEKQGLAPADKKNRLYRGLVAKGFESADVAALVGKEDYRFGQGSD